MNGDPDSPRVSAEVHAMIDAFQFYVWPPESDLHEDFPFGPMPVDSPQARRLLCLVAEARAAGVPTRVLFHILLDWARVLHRSAAGDAWRETLGQAVTAMDAALYRPEPPQPDSIQRAFAIIDAAEPGGTDDTPALRVARLLGSHFGELISRGAEADPETAWDAALLTLAAIAETVGPSATEAAMTDCAEVAYARLFSGASCCRDPRGVSPAANS
jgi:hypothetical protein